MLSLRLGLLVWQRMGRAMPMKQAVMEAALCFTTLVSFSQFREGRWRFTKSPSTDTRRRSIPFVLAWPFCIMSPTAVSVSLEGKNLWIAQSLPLSPGGGRWPGTGRRPPEP